VPVVLLKVILVPKYESEATPSPPPITAAPVLIDVDGVVAAMVSPESVDEASVLLIDPPKYAAPSAPSPPLITNAPVLVDVEGVVAITDNPINVEDINPAYIVPVVLIVPFA
jgi:hypothetical protein